MIHWLLSEHARYYSAWCDRMPSTAARLIFGSDQPTKESVNLSRQSLLKDNYETVATLNYYNLNYRTVNQLEPRFLDLVQSISSPCGLTLVQSIGGTWLGFLGFDVESIYIINNIASQYAKKYVISRCVGWWWRSRICQKCRNRTSMVWFITWITFLGVTRSTKPKLRRIDPDQIEIEMNSHSVKTCRALPFRFSLNGFLNSLYPNLYHFVRFSRCPISIASSVTRSSTRWCNVNTHLKLKSSFCLGLMYICYSCLNLKKFFDIYFRFENVYLWDPSVLLII